MTYYEEDGRGEVVPELGLRFAASNCDYVKLSVGPEDSVTEPEKSPAEIVAVVNPWWYWARLVLLIACAGLIAGVCIKWVGPFVMDKGIIPLIDWETKTFSRPVLAILVFASVAIFPTILIPSSPSMWVAGMTFGYGFGFLLIIAGASIGVSLPYFIGSVFHHRIQGWLEKYPKRASILRSAGEGNWFHQFRAVSLIRVSPFPYMIYNYCAVATDVKYVPYFFGSMVGMVPEIFVTIYTGIVIRTIADASAEKHGLTAPQIFFTGLGFLAAAVATAFITVYAKRKLKEIQSEDDLLLQ